jgi:dTDP-4-amino-4,6-dideoxygalactose transaminase
MYGSTSPLEPKVRIVTRTPRTVTDTVPVSGRGQARWRDLVEEFWDAEALFECRRQASGVQAYDFLDALRDRLGASGKFWAAPSARVALREFLRAIARDGRRRVLVCSLNCGVIAEAVGDAGLRVETYDLADVTGRMDWDELADRLSPGHAALLVSHLFGVPTDFRPIRSAAERHGVLIVEDCAQTLGGRVDGTGAGTLGDAAVFSFNYDKPLSLGGGGVLLVNNPALWQDVQPGWRQPDLRREEREMRLFLRYLDRRRTIGGSREPALRAWVRRLNASAGRPPFPATGIGPLRAALGIWQLERFDAIIGERNARADMFATRTASGWHVGPAVQPAWLKQKAYKENGARIAAALRRRGLPIGAFNWPVTLDERFGASGNPNAARIARHSFDIPIHQNLSWAELDQISAAFADDPLAAKR